MSFSWAESEWVRFCAVRGISSRLCGAQIGKHPNSCVYHATRVLGLRFKSRRGPKHGHQPSNPFTAETGRAAAARRANPKLNNLFVTETGRAAAEARWSAK
jgi:hypothetical protein